MLAKLNMARNGFFTAGQLFVRLSQPFNKPPSRNFPFAAEADLYRVLGIPKVASQDDIKKAYFKLAKQFHPDINKSPDSHDRFAEINKAYEVLGDESKREEYDKAYGTTKQKVREKYSERWNEDRYAEYEAINEMLKRKFKTKKQKPPRAAGDITLNLSVDFMEAVNGTRRTLEYDRTELCRSCSGTGGTVVPCKFCKGNGYTIIKRGAAVYSVSCNHCSGIGVTTANACGHCSGHGSIRKTIKYELKVPRGISDGNTLRVPKMGNEHASKRCGDLMIKIKVKPHNYFKREGRDIHTDRKITISQAVLGDIIEVTTLYGKKKVPIHAGTETGALHKIVGYGLEHPSSLNNSKGNHYVHFVVDIPTNLTPQQYATMRNYSYYEEPIPAVSMHEADI